MSGSGRKTYRVLVATRGSEPALRACRIAAELLPREATVVRLLTVLPEELYPNPYTIAGKDMSDMRERLENVRVAAESALAEPRRIFEEAGHAVETSYRYGNPPREILNEIEDWKPDLMVMGWWRAKVPERLVTGSIFERVMGHTDVPVLMVRHPG